MDMRHALVLWFVIIASASIICYGQNSVAPLVSPVSNKLNPFPNLLKEIFTAGPNSIAPSYSAIITRTLLEEVLGYRIWVLIIGILLMTLSSFISQSIVFYYIGSILSVICFVILFLLYHAMKLRPTSIKSWFVVVMVPCFAGLFRSLDVLGITFVPTTSILLRSMFVDQLGVSEEIYSYLPNLLLVLVLISGASVGFWIFRKFVLTDEGSIDKVVARWVKWKIRVFASVIILMSSPDHLLAIMASVVVIIAYSSVLKRDFIAKVICSVYKNVAKLSKIRRKECAAAVGSTDMKSLSSLFSDHVNFYSVFHCKNADRVILSKDEWKMFTKASTRKALQGLVSSPDFTRWSVENADKITLLPPKIKKRRWFSWA